jgi:ABC-type proline/glycine betaine transport system substrate-binding protein
VVKKYLGSSKTWKTVRKNNIAVVNKAKRKNFKKKETVALIGYKVVVK